MIETLKSEKPLPLIYQPQQCLHVEKKVLKQILLNDNLFVLLKSLLLTLNFCSLTPQPESIYESLFRRNS